MNRLTTFFLMTILLILVSCMDPEMSGDDSNDNNTPTPPPVPDFVILEAEKGNFPITLPPPFPGGMGIMVNTSHRIKVQINRDISALLFETDQSDFTFVTLSSIEFGAFNPNAVTSNAITADQEIYVYPENTQASITNFTVTKSEIYFYNDSGDQEVIESVENTMFSNL